MELPAPKSSKALPQRDAHMLILQDDQGRILLQRRPPVGIWASLWSLPEYADGETAQVWFGQHIEGDFSAARALPVLMHGFSHYRLRIHPQLIAVNGLRSAVSDNDNLRWIHRADLHTLGLPAPVRKLLEQTQ